MNITMSSSRSIAAARNRRANDAPPTPQPQQTRPITSINSATSLKQQQPTNSKPPHPPSQQPFNKISVSDAIGLITLRLGKIEQYIIDTQNESKEYDLPANAKLVDNSVLLSLLSRIETLETKLKDMNTSSNANIKKEPLFDVQKALEFQKQMEQLSNNNRE